MKKKAIVRQYMQYRAEALKSLTEQRAELVQQMKDLTATAETEKRAFSQEEDQQFNDLDKQVKALDSTIEKLERARDLKLNTVTTEKHEELKKEELEERAFAAYIRGETLKERADVNLTVGNNGAVIPSSIAQKIIKKVYDICPIYQLATRYNVGGTLSIPYYDEETQTIEMAYATEFTELESTSGKFGSIELKGFLAGALSKVSKSLVNNSQFDITSFVVQAMAEAISKWIEKELLNGTANKIDGLSKVTQTVTASAVAAIKADELIDIQETIPDAYQGGAIWVMNKATRTAIRKLKDNDGNYILNKDPAARWGYTLFGKDIYTSDNMSAMAAGKTAIYYGDFSGLAVKLSEDVSIEVLREKYATQHAIGVVGWIEIDSKVENAQKIAKLVMKASA
nr:MAG TPA: major capsid protein [Caudoviricetes sp.]